MCTQLYTHVYTVVYTRVYCLALSMSPVGLSYTGLPELTLRYTTIRLRLPRTGHNPLKEPKRGAYNDRCRPRHPPNKSPTLAHITMSCRDQEKANKGGVEAETSWEKESEKRSREEAMKVGRYLSKRTDTVHLVPFLYLCVKPQVGLCR